MSMVFAFDQEEAFDRGIERGMQQGAVSILVDLVKDNTIMIEVAAKKAKMTEKDFRLLIR